MRFETGSIVPFIGISFKHAGGYTGSIGMGNLYRPWEGAYTSMKIELMRCAQHHKVPNAHDMKNELSCDGFIFERVDDPTDQWFNQYPRAAYSQTSTASDSVVWRNKELKDEDDEADWAMISVKSFLEDLERGVKQTLDQGMTVEHEALKLHRDEVLEKLKEKGVTVEIAPHMFGERQLKDRFKAVIAVNGNVLAQSV